MMASEDDGWLSTRNKSKVQPKQKLLRRRLSLPQQQKPLNEFVLSQSPPPEELFKNTKQSHLTSFFKPHLKTSVENEKGTSKQYLHKAMTRKDENNTKDPSKQQLQNIVTVKDGVQLDGVHSTRAAVTRNSSGDASNRQRSNLAEQIHVGLYSEKDDQVKTNQMLKTTCVMLQKDKTSEHSIDGFQMIRPDTHTCIAKSSSRMKRKLGEHGNCETDFGNNEKLSDEENIDCLAVKHLMEDSIQKLNSSDTERLKRVKKFLKIDNEIECDHHDDDTTQTRVGYWSKPNVDSGNEDIFLKDKETTNVLENSSQSSVHKTSKRKCNTKSGESDTTNIDKKIGTCSVVFHNNFLENTSQLNDQTQNMGTEDDTNYAVPTILKTSIESNIKQAKCDNVDTSSVEEQEQFSLSPPDESQLSLSETETDQLSFDNSLQLESQFTFRSQREYYDALEKGDDVDKLYSGEDTILSGLDETQSQCNKF